MTDPKAIENPFFLMFPDWALIPMVGLATAATVIASQAVITGAYSLTRSAIQLGLLPRFEIRHTSEAHSGQIYIPRINMLLLVSVILLVLLFRSSTALASAYGISVTGTMVVTGMMGFVVIWKVWKWSPLAAVCLMAPFLFLDLTFLAANLLKVFEGGWVPLALGAVVMLLMYTWRRGSRLLFEKSRKLEFPLAELVAMLEKRPPQRVPGTAVFLTSDPQCAPTALMHSLKHYKVLHEKNVILTIETAPSPRIDPAERVRMEQISETFSRVTLRFGFMESPNVPKALAIARKLGWQFDIMSTSFFLSRRALKPSAQSGMPRMAGSSASSRSAARPTTPPTISRSRPDASSAAWTARRRRTRRRRPARAGSPGRTPASGTCRRSASARLDPAELAGARVQQPQLVAVDARRMRHRQPADDDLARSARR